MTPKEPSSPTTIRLYPSDRDIIGYLQKELGLELTDLVRLALRRMKKRMEIEATVSHA